MASDAPGARHVFFDHTGDFGVDLAAPAPEALYEEAARAFVALLTDLAERVAETQTRPIAARGLDATDLLVALGNELLFWFETEGWLVSRIHVEALDETSVRGVAYGETYDPTHHSIARPVKAVTHHGAEVRHENGEYVGRLIFDL